LFLSLSYIDSAVAAHQKSLFDGHGEKERESGKQLKMMAN
jgi:hypothetical protein